jgi:hypothetical protein
VLVHLNHITARETAAMKLGVFYFPSAMSNNFSFSNNRFQKDISFVYPKFRISDKMIAKVKKILSLSVNFI